MAETNAPPTESKLVFSERETQILAVAEELLLKWGYKRVTMEDIARYANIGKGTLYLHWKSREALFQTLLLNEALQVWQILMARVEAMPQEVRYSRLLRALLLLLPERPLSRALFLGDMEVLGKLAGSGATPAMRSGQWMAMTQFTTLYRTHGLFRTDHTPEEQIYLLEATVSGFFGAPAASEMPNPLSLERRADLLAETIATLFEPPTPPSDTQLAASMREITSWMRQSLAQYEQIIQVLMH